MFIRRYFKTISNERKLALCSPLPTIFSSYNHNIFRPDNINKRRR